MSRGLDLENLLEKSEGSTGETCKGMIHMMLLAQPKVHIWENVPTILEPRNARNLKFLSAALREVGYEHYYGRLNSAKFGHPTSRERAFGVCVNFRLMSGGAPAAQERAQQIFEFARIHLTFDVLPLQNILLPASDVHVRQDVAHLQSLKEPHIAHEVCRR